MRILTLVCSVPPDLGVLFASPAHVGGGCGARHAALAATELDLLSLAFIR